MQTPTTPSRSIKTEEEEEGSPTPPPQIPSPSPPPANLTLHIVHLVNILTSQLTAYLSLETLYRVCPTSTNDFAPIMVAQAAMMVDAGANLALAVQQTTFPTSSTSQAASPLHESLRKACQGLGFVIGMLKDEKLDWEQEEIGKLRLICDGLVLLCHGNEAKGLVGWKGCWEEVRESAEEVREPTEEVREPTEEVREPTEEVRESKEEVKESKEEVRESKEEVTESTEASEEITR